MKSKRNFYILEKTDSSKEKNEQKTEITESQKERRQKWLDQLKGIKPLENDETNVNSEMQQFTDMDINQIQESMEFKKSDNMQNQEDNKQNSSENSDMQATNIDMKRLKQLEEELAKLYEEELLEMEKNPGTELDLTKVKRKFMEEKQIPNSIIKMLVDKFIKKEIIMENTDLNNMQKSLESNYGNLQWNISDLVKHQITKDFNKMPYDKLGYKGENGGRTEYTICFICRFIS